MYHDEHIKVSIVSVSRREGAWQIGQVVIAQVGCSLSGLSPVGRHRHHPATVLAVGRPEQVPRHAPGSK